MKFVIVLFVAVACVFADVSHLEATAPIVKSNYESSPEGNYQYEYETGNGIFAQAQGVVKPAANGGPSLEVQGAYRYTSPDGTPVETSYNAGEGGFNAVGSHIPVSPPIPELIARALAYIAAHPPQAESPKPSYG